MAGNFSWQRSRAGLSPAANCAFGIVISAARGRRSADEDTEGERRTGSWGDDTMVGKLAEREGGGGLFLLRETALQRVN